MTSSVDVVSKLALLLKWLNCCVLISTAKANEVGSANSALKTNCYWCWNIGGLPRTQFHIATRKGLSESAVCRLIAKVETLLMNSGKFRLPGKKQLYQNAYIWEVLVVDVTESPIERPKKNSELTIVARKSGIRSKRK